MEWTLIILSTVCILATAIPLLPHKIWWIRMFDFPQLQLTVITTVALMLVIFLLGVEQWHFLLLIVLLSASLVWHISIILPYTGLHKKQVASTTIQQSKNSIRVFSSNVLQDNTDFDRFLKVFRSANPDIAVLLEANFWWEEQLQVVQKDYPYRVSYPLENYYGMILISKFPLKETKVQFLMDDTIPSIYAKAQLKQGTWVTLYCLHPMPPSPTENDTSLDRDAELLLVADKISEKDYPVLVLGDLNDVAWSHTTRMFQRISRLLDPRIGRGFYNTFHANYLLLRWPLDHLFVSKDFKLAELKRMPNVGSDHFPMYAELCYDCLTEENSSPDKASDEDKQEVENTIEEGLKENGKQPFE